MADAVAGLPVYRTYVEPGDRRASRSTTARPSRRPTCPSACARPWWRRADAGRGGLRGALPADHRRGHGQGRRGHGALPLHAPASRSTRSAPTPGRWGGRPTRCTPPTPSARGALPARPAGHPDPRHQALGRRARAHRRPRRRCPACGASGSLRWWELNAPLRATAPPPPGRGVPDLPDPGRGLAARARAPARTTWSRRCARPRSTTGWVEPDERHEAAVQRASSTALYASARVRRRPGGRSSREVAPLGEARRPRPDAAQADLARASRTSTRATSCGTSRWSTRTTAGPWTGTCAGACWTSSPPARPRAARRPRCT